MLSPELRETLTFYIEGVLLALISVLGILANTLCILVLSRRPHISSYVNVILLGLAVADLLFLCSINTIEGIAVVFGPTEWSTHAKLTIIYFVRWSHFTSVYITLTISVNRFLAVGYPLRVRAWFTRRIAIRILLGICVVCALVATPTWIPLLTTADNEEDFKKALVALSYYYAWASVSLEYVLPFLVLVVTNIGILVHFRKARVRRAKMTNRNGTDGREREDPHISRMLFSVVAVFGLCSVCFFAFDICTLYVLSKLESDLEGALTLHGSDEYFHLNIWANVLVVLNSSVNFLIYVVCSRPFRESVTKLLRINQCLQMLGVRPQYNVYGSSTSATATAPTAVAKSSGPGAISEPSTQSTHSTQSTDGRE